MTIDITQSIGYFENGVKLGTSTASLDAMLVGTATIDVASIAAGAEATYSVTVTGAAPGDPCIIGHDLALDSVVFSAWVNVADAVLVTLTNTHASAAADPVSVTVTAVVFQVTV